MTESRGTRRESGSISPEAVSETLLIATEPRLLWVDRDRALTTRVRAVLARERPNWVLTLVDSGSDALSQLEIAGFEVVATELKAAGTDGLTLLKLLGQRFPSVVSVVHSSHLGLFGQERVSQHADFLLAKPATDAALLDVLDRALSKRRAQVSELYATA
jgi:DNA-binding NtrC family response regulator